MPTLTEAAVVTDSVIEWREQEQESCWEEGERRRSFLLFKQRHCLPDKQETKQTCRPLGVASCSSLRFRIVCD
jgi:hypothetical protein